MGLLVNINELKFKWLLVVEYRMYGDVVRSIVSDCERRGELIPISGKLRLSIRSGCRWSFCSPVLLNVDKSTFHSAVIGLNEL